MANISFSQDLSAPDQTKQLQELDKLIESQSATPTLDNIKLVFSAYTAGSPAVRAAVEKSIPRLHMTDEIIDWLKSDAARSPNRDIRLLTLRTVSVNFASRFNVEFSPIFLYDPDKAIRLENIRVLKGLPLICGSWIYEELIPRLDVTLTDGYYPVRKTALEALAKYHYTPRTAEIIISRYPAESSMTLQFDMEDAIVSLINRSARADILLNYLDSDSPAIRALICRVIGKSTALNNKETYIKALNALPADSPTDVIASRDWALKQLNRLGPGPVKIDIKPPARMPIASLANRFAPGRTELLAKYHGDDRTENAARLGLDWLARNQEANGSWNCARNNPWHNNVVIPSFTNEDELVDVSVSGLSLLCFLGDGSTHQSGLYQENVRKGLEFIKTAQDKTGCVNIPKGHVHNKQCLEQGEDHGQLARRYNHNISTLFLVELYAMTNDAQIKDMAQRALEHSKNTPEPGFPWSFYLEPTDMGPSIFYILALRIAQATDLAISDKEIDRTKVYLDRLTDKSSGRIVHICAIPICFGGMDSTASGLFGHILMKNDKAVIAKGADWLKQFLPQWEPFYRHTDYYPSLLFLEENVMNEWHWYYQTLAFRQLGGSYWYEWNKSHKDVLLKHQRTGGLLDGSWDPEGPWATIGGRVYSTAFSILSLQAYYSYSFNK